MDEKTAMQKAISLSLCNKLITELRMNEGDTDSFFGGELYRVYTDANDRALEKAKKIRNKLRYL